MGSKGYDSKRLISNEIAIIQNDWKIIMEKKENGRILFLKFFKKYPQNQQKFKKLAKMTFDELTTSKVLLAHSLKVMYTISSVIDNLDQFEIATEILKTIGETHRKNNIQKQSYNELKECVIELLKENIESFNSEHDVIWNKVLTSAFQIITDQL